MKKILLIFCLVLGLQMGADAVIVDPYIAPVPNYYSGSVVDFSINTGYPYYYCDPYYPYYCRPYYSSGVYVSPYWNVGIGIGIGGYHRPHHYHHVPSYRPHHGGHIAPPPPHHGGHIAPPSHHGGGHIAPPHHGGGHPVGHASAPKGGAHPTVHSGGGHRPSGGSHVSHGGGHGGHHK